ncbi:S8 family serine peptidase [Haladaptatus litoreus]|uniref:S8 family serine peptidase n=1 Tax=Haladaptatus litoreus TaxID=553468 RepID=UPI0011159E77|nr:S8 family serine peptidase [Haladaptatus litoreus]
MSQQTRRSFLKISGTALGGIAVGTTVTAAESTERFIVKSKNVSAADLDASGVEVVHDLSAIDRLVVSGNESDVESLGGGYAPDTVYSLDLPITQSPITQDESATDEPFYPLQWDKQEQNIPEAHKVTRGEGTRVSVIDTGIDPTHPDLAHAVNTELSRNFTSDGGDFTDSGYHGTHVSGIVAANDQNETGVVGSAPGTDLVACRVFGAEGGASWGDILTALVYSVEVGADVANLSLGAYPVPRNEDNFGQFYGGTLNRTMAYARRNGTLVVAAAGNDAADLQHDGNVISVPNEASNVMSISATGPIGFNWGDDGLEEPTTTPALYTNYGTNAIDISAPGGNYDPNAPDDVYFYDLVYNTIPSWMGGYAWLAGTSMAAPQVAAAAAMIKSVNPNYNANQVRKTLRNTADRVGDKEYHGKGHLNTNAAVRE